MGLFDRLRGKGESLAEMQMVALGQENYALGSEQELLQERIADLELSLEDLNWTRLGYETSTEFSRQGLKRIAALSRVFFLKNPLINRAVTLQAQYVWGQGVSISGKHPDVDGVVQAFLDDPKNQVELTSHQARILKEQDLQVEGNLFFVLFPNRATGRIRVRTIPPDEINDILCNPDDRKEPWLYERVWQAQTFDMGSGLRMTPGLQHAYYPDWRYCPTAKPATIGGRPVMWDSPVYHVKVGGLSTMVFGVPETYQAFDWARAYKDFLEDWSTIVRAYSKFAWQLTTKGGKKGVAAAKARLGTTVGVGSGSGMADNNPPGPAGSIFATYEGGADMQPIKPAGATTSAEDGRRLLLMVAAATGLPETFFGDTNTGSLATAKSLDRPTELKFRDRQTLWADIYDNLLQYVIEKAALAPKGKIRGSQQWNDEMDEQIVVLENDPETGEPIDRHIDIDFPAILEHDKAAEMAAIVQAATLEGKALAGTMDLPTVTRLVLTALGQDDIDDILADMFPEGWEEEQAAKEEADRAHALALAQARGIIPGQPEATQASTEPPEGQQPMAPVQAKANEALAEALRELREAISAFGNAA